MLSDPVGAGAIVGLFPMTVSACVATDAMREAPLFAEEWDAVARSHPARRREFAAGRASAREALRALGAPAVALPVGGGRAPLWPDGFVGSITHTGDFCAAVAARTGETAGLGLDAEAADPLEPGLESLVCRADDYPLGAVVGDLGDVAWSKVIFSVKEAFYKCQYPLTRRFIDFEDAGVRFEPRQTARGGGFTVRAWPDGEPGGASLQGSGRWLIAGGLVVCGVWLDRSAHAGLAQG